MTKELEERLFAATMRTIRAEWKKRKDIGSFANLAICEMRYLQGDYKVQKAQIIAYQVEQKLIGAAQKLQLQVATRLEITRFPRFSGISIQVSHQSIRYGEIFIGPTNDWDKLMFLAPQRGFWAHQDNPYTKKRLKEWQSVEQFDFDSFMACVKEDIDRPPVTDTGDDDDEMPF